MKLIKKHNKQTKIKKENKYKRHSKKINKNNKTKTTKKTNKTNKTKTTKKTRQTRITLPMKDESTKFSYLKTLQYPIPLLRNLLSEQDIKELMNNESIDNNKNKKWKIIHNKTKKYTSLKSSLRSSSILKDNYTLNDFDLVYKIAELEPSLIYYIQEEYILRKNNILSYHNFITTWNTNNTKFFNDLINHDMPFFKAKYKLASKYNYFIKYIYPVNIYIDINKNILEDIIKSKTKQNNNDRCDINIFSPYMDEGNILYSFLNLQNMFKHKINMHFQGCTFNKTCFDGFNTLMNLLKIEKQPINKEKYNNNYIQNSFKNNFDLFNGEYPIENLEPNTMDIIETFLPNWSRLTEGFLYKSYLQSKDTVLNSAINIFKLFKFLKDEGIIVIFIENLTTGIINLLNNIMKYYYNPSEITSNFNQNTDITFSIEFIKSIRITKFDGLDDHDNFIFIFKKIHHKDNILDTKIMTRSDYLKNLVYMDIKLPGNRNITAIYELCKNTDKLLYECSKGYITQLEYKLHQNFSNHLKKMGYKKYFYILEFLKVGYEPLIESLLEHNFKIYLILIVFKINANLLYIYQKMIYDFKYKYNAEIFFMTPNELEQLWNTVNQNECYFNSYIYNGYIKENLFNDEVQIVKEYLTPIFINYNTIWHHCNPLYSRYLCSAFPDKKFNYITYQIASYDETHIILKYKSLGLKNLNVILPVVPLKPFPNISEIRDSVHIKEHDMQPCFYILLFYI